MVRFNNRKHRSFPSRNSKKKSGNIIGRIFYWLCLLAFLGSLIYVLFFSNWTKIIEINIQGTEYLNRELVQSMISSRIEGKYLNLIEKNNYLLISEESIQRDMLETFLKIQSVEVKKKFPNKLNINLIERDIALVFCRNEKCFIVNEDGIAFTQINHDDFQQFGEQIITLQSDKGKDIGVGDFILEKDFNQYLLGIKSKLENIDIEIENKISTSQLISGDLRIRTKNGWSIYFDKEIPLEKEVEMLRILLDNQLKEVNLKKLDYIDLRSDKKIYYKFKDSEEKPSQQNSEQEKNEDKNPQS